MKTTRAEALYLVAGGAVLAVILPFALAQHLGY